MTKQEFLAQIETLFEMDPGELSEDSVLTELAAWDSMAAIGFIAMADANVNVAIRPQKLFECRTVGDLVTLVEEKLT